MEQKVLRFGLSKVYWPADGKSPTVDVVFVHGLFGHPYRTWTYKQSNTSKPETDPTPQKKFSFFSSLRSGKNKSAKSSDAASAEAPAHAGEANSGGAIASTSKSNDIFWPHDLLPSVLDRANIYTWGYDVDILNIATAASQSSIFQHSVTLLNNLADVRTLACDKARPIIFVAHSLGGIVVKDALNLSRNEKTHLNEILPATIGVCFLGTPHRGSVPASMGTIAFELSKAFFQHPNITVLRTLETKSEILERVGKGFSQILVDRKISVSCFKEELPMAGVMIVDTSSYSLGDGLEVTQNIHANHVNMTKFGSSEEQGFKSVSAVLLRWASGKTEAPLSVRAQKLLNSLDNPEARVRVQNVEKTFGDTYNWVFNEGVGFASWLRDPRSNIFWIQGKPGSGKSTLMKYIMQDPRTSEMLSGSEPASRTLVRLQSWTIASHFFHGRGFMVEKTITGLLCEVLRQILVQNPDLIEYVQPYYDGRPCNDSILLESFDAIAAQRNSKVNLCLFIDALDEHMGDHRKLLQFFRRLLSKTPLGSMRIKLCVASRPENVFETHLSEFNGFRIQDHNMKDIEAYTSGRLYPESTRRSSDFKEQLPVLVEDVVKLAAGVFLWVKLVVDEMIECICEGDTITDLRKLLSSIPTQMEGLYARAIGRMNDRKVSKEVKKRWARESLIMFNFMKRRTTLMYGAIELVQAVQHSISGTFDQYLSVEDAMQWITGRSAGLLECVVMPKAKSQLMIQFIHQTAKDFITTDQVRSILTPSLDDSSENDDLQFMEAQRLLKYRADKNAMDRRNIVLGRPDTAE